MAAIHVLGRTWCTFSNHRHAAFLSSPSYFTIFTSGSLAYFVVSTYSASHSIYLLFTAYLISGSLFVSFFCVAQKVIQNQHFLGKARNLKKGVIWLVTSPVINIRMP